MICLQINLTIPHIQHATTMQLLLWSDCTNPKVLREADFSSIITREINATLDNKLLQSWKANSNCYSHLFVLAEHNLCSSNLSAMWEVFLNSWCQLSTPTFVAPNMLICSYFCARTATVMLTVLMTTIQFNLFVMIRAVRKSRIHDRRDYRYFHRVPWFLAIAVISCHGREYSRIICNISF